MRESPRRRRFDDEPRGGGGLPLFPLILVVVLAGLLLGGVLAHFFGGSKREPGTSPTAVAQAPSPVTTAEPIVASSASPKPTSTATSAPTPTPTPTPASSSSPKPRASVAVAPSTTPKALATPRRVATVPSHVPPTASPTPAPMTTSNATPKPAVARAIPVAALPRASSRSAASGDDRAATVVRSYLEALSRGDRAAAGSYLAHGTPSETFMGSGSHIESIRSASESAGQYKVTADVQTAAGEYFVTFTLESGPTGLQITDHYAIKPQ